MKANMKSMSSYLEIWTILCTLSWFSYVGEFLRVILEKLWGSQCLHGKSPGGCVTSDGLSGHIGNGFTGGAIFIDLPINALGCFIMGLLTSGDHNDHIPVNNMPLACLRRSSPFQSWNLWHMGLRTGFCGSFTTFASWNTQMVSMICDGQWFAAIFGYIVGLGLSLSAYEMGRHVSIGLHRWCNQDLRREADILAARWEKQPFHFAHPNMQHYRNLSDYERRFLQSIEGLSRRSSILNHNDNSQKVKREEWRRSSLRESHRALPDSERRVLYDLEEEGKEENSSSSRQHHEHNDLHQKLNQWKKTTDLHRRGLAQEDYQTQLEQLEYAILVNNEEELDADLVDIANDAGWDINALQSWKRGQTKTKEQRSSVNIQFVISTLLFLILTTLLIVGVVVATPTASSFLSRTEYLSTLASPLGTLTRWQLSKYNGTLSEKYIWLPIGTLLANLLGSILSVLAVGIGSTSNNETVILWMAVLKTGYAGCLSTVSTLAAETVGLFQMLPRFAYGYYYAIGSILVAATLGILSSVWFTL
mmetsp:Transcript_6577/g.10044  ORF Transcript_6577/g.10044 Transcript_6577/m.10044 type:complete len:532 (-) Transcript_6577:488-2083(-)